MACYRTLLLHLQNMPIYQSLNQVLNVEKFTNKFPSANHGTGSPQNIKDSMTKSVNA